MRIKEGVNLFPHQAKALKFCSDRETALVCFDTGSGKSLIMIAAALKAVRSGRVKKFIIVVTASSIIEIENDFEKFTDGAPTRIQTIEDLSTFMSDDSMIGVMQYTWMAHFGEFSTDYTGKRKYFNLYREVQDLLYKHPFGMCFDEVHCLKTPKTKITKASRKLREFASICYGFTATPLTRELFDLYYVVEFIHPKWFGAFVDFRYKYVKFYMMGMIPVVTGYKNLEKLNQYLINLMITYFPKKDIEFTVHTCPLSLQEPYRLAAEGLFNSETEIDEEEFSKELAKELDEEDEVGGDDHITTKETEKTFAARLVDLQYVVNDDPNKQELFKKVIKEKIADGVIIYCAYHRSIAIVEELLKELKIPSMQITGKKTVVLRKKAKEWFNESPKGKALILSRAGGQSLNLQACPSMIFFETPQNPAALLQVLGRIVRIGSKYDKFSISFVAVEDTVDQYKYDFVSQNREVFLKVLNNETLPSSDALSGFNSFIIQKLKKSYLWDRR